MSLMKEIFILCYLCLRYKGNLYVKAIYFYDKINSNLRAIYVNDKKI